MSTDRELLELAAKAAGITLRYNYLGTQDARCSWDPLNDDGDALRLLAAMPSLWSLSLKFGAPTVEMNVWWGTGGEKTNKIAREFAGDGVDVAAAIRRAIVRAAADVGRDVS